MTAWMIGRGIRRIALACTVLAAALAGPARAAGDGAADYASAWDKSETTAVRLISAQTAVDGMGAASFGLHIQLAPNWKVYWRTPGDAGFPPQIDWSGSDNLAEVEIAWPAPTRLFELGGLVTHGYMDEVVLPITARAIEPGRPIDLRAAVNYLACEKICVPFDADLELTLLPGPAAPTPFAELIAGFEARVPGPPETGSPVVESAEVAGAGADRFLRVVAQSPVPFDAPEIFVEGPDLLYFMAPDLEMDAGGTQAVFRMVAPEDRDGTPIVGESLTFTLVDGDRAVEQAVVAVAGAAEGPRLGALALILTLAFLGGLILNLMPCVLPVLSLKIMGVIALGGAERSRITTRFAAAAAGIVAAFLALAGVVIALKTAGLAVGWGIQYQEPLFLIALVVILTLFSANLWNLFEIGLPAWLGGLGAGGGRADSVAGHFLSGAFATVLATPCTAPFLGTAVGFALARGVPEILAVFTALGLGMAAPYLLVAAFPGLAARLPRPGPWMMTVRRVLGVLLAATAVWLLTVLEAQTGLRATLVVSALMVAAVAVLWYARRAGRMGPAMGAVSALFVFAFIAPGQIESSPAPAPPAAVESLWQPFDRAAIAEHVAAGRTVLVDVTADWCVTCQFNKKTVLDRGEVARRLTEGQIIAMRADWTRPNTEIAEYLEDFSRFGIPFNAVYGPALPRGFALPELLTESAVIAAFDRAGSTVASNE